MVVRRIDTNERDFILLHWDRLVPATPRVARSVTRETEMRSIYRTISFSKEIRGFRRNRVLFNPMKFIINYLMYCHRDVLLSFYFAMRLSHKLVPFFFLFNIFLYPTYFTYSLDMYAISFIAYMSHHYRWWVMFLNNREVIDILCESSRAMDTCYRRNLWQSDIHLHTC